MQGQRSFDEFVEALLGCRKCSTVVGPPVCGSVRNSKIIAIGQAPGPHEARFGKPFAYTAGRTLFKWMASIGISEDVYRANVNMSAVLRCFPGKAKSSSSKSAGDRVPSPAEIENCKEHLEFEFGFLRPQLVIPIGKLAIGVTMPEAARSPLADVIGRKFPVSAFGARFDCIPLPHPSGLNVWNNVEPGKTLLVKALSLIKKHPAARELIKKTSEAS